MLGYTKRLKAGENAQTMERMTLALQSKVTRYEAEIQQLRVLCERLESLATFMSTATNEDVIGRQKLCCGIEALEARCGELGAMLTQCDHDRVLESTDHRQKVEALEEELRRCNVEYKTLKRTMRSMVETPRGYRQRIHGARMKSFSDLSCGSGYAKRQRALLRGILQPAVVAGVQHANKEGGGKKRLSGDFAAQVKTAECVARPSEAAAMIDQPRMSQATTSMVKKVIKRIGDSIGEDCMLDSCDVARVTGRGYTSIYKTVKNRIGLIAPGFKSSILPAPHRLAKLRKEMNAKLPQFIGEYYSIEGRRIIPEVRVAGKVITSAKEVILDSNNSLFVDLEVVQRSMVMFYEMTIEGKMVALFSELVWSTAIIL